MRLSSIVMLVVALVFGVAAAFLAKTWLEGGSPEPLVAERPQTPMATIVVASEPLRFGVELGRSHLREMAWPAESLPAGTFAKIADVLGKGERRVVLSAVEANEPLMQWKITGPGQRASLSAVVDEHMKAVAIRVTDVQGVAGFVLPGERVDVLLTRVEAAELKDPAKKPTAYTDVILQSVRVLAVDQLADDRTEKPALVKSVTIEASIEQAQKVALAASVGELSLALRSAGSTAPSATRRISLGDLSDGRDLPADNKGLQALIGVTRGVDRSEYNVPRARKDSIN